ncbi:MAG: hypothetical protein KatS3mg132_262 [Limisphaera sp.]|nr:MAG: hypothetical protein KatS3mg132_262 [Limisphaera sp.]
MIGPDNRREFELEALEPRILLSADTLGVSGLRWPGTAAEPLPEDPLATVRDVPQSEAVVCSVALDAAAELSEEASSDSSEAPAGEALDQSDTDFMPGRDQLAGSEDVVSGGDSAGDADDGFGGLSSAVWVTLAGVESAGSVLDGSTGVAGSGTEEPGGDPGGGGSEVVSADAADAVVAVEPDELTKGVAATLDLEDGEGGAVGAALSPFAAQLVETLRAANGPPAAEEGIHLNPNEVLDLGGGTLYLQEGQVLSGNGTVVGGVAGNGVIRPGNSPGHIVVTTFQPGPDAVTEIEIQGTYAGISV